MQKKFDSLVYTLIKNKTGSEIFKNHSPPSISPTVRPTKQIHANPKWQVTDQTDLFIANSKYERCRLAKKTYLIVYIMYT